MTMVLEVRMMLSAYNKPFCVDIVWLNHIRTTPIGNESIYNSTQKLFERWQLNKKLKYYGSNVYIYEFNYIYVYTWLRKNIPHYIELTDQFI